MRILATSDLHGNLPVIEPCDLLIIGGDICPDDGVLGQRNWLTSTFRTWLEEVPAKDIVGIAGNHDFILEVEVPDLPWIYLRDTEVTIEDIRIWGTPWVPNLPRWAFYAPDDKLKEYCDRIPEGIDILVSHGPPFGVGDQCGTKYGSSVGEHVGSHALKDRIAEVQPSVVVCGHIHEGYGLYGLGSLYGLGKTHLYNVALVDEFYTPSHEPVEVFVSEDDMTPLERSDT